METLRIRNQYPEEERGGKFQAEGLDKISSTADNSV